MGYLEELFGLGGLRALVTGGASGIGFALARVGRNGVPADIETAAVFLASRASGYVTGQLVFVDGGFSAH